MKALKAKYGHPFVYKPHNLCLEEVHVICATILIAKILNKGKHSVFHMQYVVDRGLIHGFFLPPMFFK